MYTYNTSGFEEIDRPHERHEYPQSTTISLRHTDCGFVARWQPLETRWDQLDVCTGRSTAQLNGMATSREFFGRRQESTYVCDTGSIAWSTGPGARFTSRCDDGATVVQTSGRVVGREAVQVGDDVVEAVHVSLRSTMEGQTRGTWVIDRWLHPDTGLLLRAVGRTDVTSDSPIGEVHYREQIDNRLTSLTPRR